MTAKNVKLFRIERNSYTGESVSGPVDNALADRQHDEVMAAITDLRKIISPQETAEVQELQVNDELEAARHDLAEANKLRAEIQDIYKAIENTKREIATIHEGSLSGDRMMAVTGELDAVVNGTEQATEAILTAAEDIDSNATDLAAALKGGNHDLANDIRESAVSLFEACNFQDLTGQRITKVVETLKFIEERIIRMIDIWGGLEAFEKIDADLPTREGDDALLHGPGHHDDPDRIAQTDIDALFD